MDLFRLHKSLLQTFYFSEILGSSKKILSTVSSFWDERGSGLCGRTLDQYFPFCNHSQECLDRRLYESGTTMFTFWYILKYSDFAEAKSFQLKIYITSRLKKNDKKYYPNFQGGKFTFFLSCGSSSICPNECCSLFVVCCCCHQVRILLANSLLTLRLLRSSRTMELGHRRPTTGL